MASHFKTISRTGEFTKLSPDCVVRLLSRDDLVITSEAEVATAAVRWLRENDDLRTACAARILGCVHFGDLSPDQLVALVGEDEALFVDQALREKILEANWRVFFVVLSSYTRTLTCR